MSTLSQRLVLGIDIGGTKTAAGLVDTRGTVIEAATASTPATAGSEAVLDVAAALGQRLLGSKSAGYVLAVGVASPGVIDHHGVVLSATDLLTAWTGTAVADGIQRRLGITTAVDNDVRAAGLGEGTYGAGQGMNRIVFVAVGTGVGGSLLCNGQVVRGHSGLAGSLGHLPVIGGDELPCSCGRTGHLEAVVAGPALVRTARAQGVDVVNARQLFSLSRDQNSAGRKIIETAASILGRTLGGLANVLDPDVVIVGGGVAQGGEALWTPLTAAFRAELLHDADRVQILPAALGIHAGVIGAAVLARRSMSPSAGTSQSKLPRRR
jgi:glucokinase